MKLFGVTTTFNAAKMIPYVMPYVEAMGYDHFIVYDNESTDNTVELLKNYPFVEVRTYSTNGSSDEDANLTAKINGYCEFKYNGWIEEGERAWITVNDFDEVFYYTDTYAITRPHPGIKWWLQTISNLGYNVCTEEFIEIISEEFPVLSDSQQFVHAVANIGTHASPYFFNKPNMFRIDNLNSFYLFKGTHQGHFEFVDEPVKAIKCQPCLFAFHLKYLDKQYISDRSNTYAERGWSNYANDKTWCDTFYAYRIQNSFSIKDYMSYRQIAYQYAESDTISTNKDGVTWW